MSIACPCSLEPRGASPRLSEPIPKPAAPCRLMANENALGPSPISVAAMRQAAIGSHRYPDPRQRRIRSALASRHDVAAEQVAVGAGSSELISLLIRTLCRPGSRDDEVLGVAPDFSLYRAETEAHGVAYRTVSFGPGFEVDPGRLAAAASLRTRICVLSNPNNPTGGYLSREQLESLAGALPSHVLLVVDEAYAEYADAADFGAAAQLRRARDRVAALRTFSKAHGLAGARVGYLVAPAGVIARIDRNRNPFSVGEAAQAGALAALGDADHLARTRAHNAAGKQALSAALAEVGVKVRPSQANFLLLELPARASEMHRRLLESGLMTQPVIDGAHLRVSIGLPAENRRLVTAMAGILAECAPPGSETAA